MTAARRRIASAFCLFLGLSVAVWLRIHFGSAGSQTAARLGEPMPSLTVDDSGAEVDLREFAAGTRSVIVFYSPTCSACRETLPALQPFPATLSLIMVNESRARENPEPPGIPNAAFFYDRWSVLPRSFAIARLPTIIFVDENGILRDGLVGVHVRELVQEKLKGFAARHP